MKPYIFLLLIISALPILTACQGNSTSSRGASISGGDDLPPSPTITGWITQLGAETLGAKSNANDMCWALTTDSEGNTYCGGATTGALGESSGGGTDAFVMKLNPSGEVVWIRQLGAITSPDGTLGYDGCRGIAVDSDSNVYCGGFSEGALGESNGGSRDAFVMKLNPSGEVVWIRQLGAITSPDGKSSGDDECNGIAVDSDSNVYCGGTTQGALGEPSGGSNDAFVMKLNPSGEVAWIRQLGAITSPDGKSSGDDECLGIAVDSDSNVYCGGATTGALGESSGGDRDAFVMKLNLSGEVVWIRQLGAITSPDGKSSGDDECLGIAVDSDSNVYCGGITTGALGELSGGDRDAFAMKLNPSGEVAWIRQLGAISSPGGKSSGFDKCFGIAVDSDSNVYCGGNTTGALGEPSGGISDAFVMKLKPDGTF